MYLGYFEEKSKLIQKVGAHNPQQVAELMNHYGTEVVS
jgi:hypothetical protein